MTPLVKERCPHCGAARLAWTRGEIIEAMRRFAGIRGRAPKHDEWERARYGYPSASTVAERFGSWSAAIEAAGLMPGLRRTEWTRDSVIRAMREWHREHGRAPAAHEWRSPNGVHPSATVVRHRFGRWNLAVVAAGLEPRRRSPGQRAVYAARSSGAAA